MGIHLSDDNKQILRAHLEEKYLSHLQDINIFPENERETEESKQARLAKEAQNTKRTKWISMMAAMGITVTASMALYNALQGFVPTLIAKLPFEVVLDVRLSRVMVMVPSEFILIVIEPFNVSPSSRRRP